MHKFKSAASFRGFVCFTTLLLFSAILACESAVSSSSSANQNQSIDGDRSDNTYSLANDVLSRKSNLSATLIHNNRESASPRLVHVGEPQLSDVVELLRRTFWDKMTANSTCFRDMFALLGKLNVSTSAFMIKFMDAQSKPGPGILAGNTHWTVSYDVCNSLTSDLSSMRPSTNFPTKICNFDLEFEFAGMPQRMKLQSQVCLSKLCKLEEIQDILQQAVNETNSKLVDRKITFKSNVICKSDIPDSNDRNLWYHLNIIICSVLLIPITLGTLLEALLLCLISNINKNEIESKSSHEFGETNRDQNENKEASITRVTEKNLSNSKNFLQTFFTDPICFNIELEIKKLKKNLKLPYKILFCFSFITNFNNLMHVDSTPNSSANKTPMITCLYGIRFFSIIYVFYLHFYSFPLEPDGILIGNRNSFTWKIFHEWQYNILLNAGVCVDTFFVISGLLIVYTSLHSLKRLENTRKFYFSMIFRRFFRLTPTYFFVIIFATGVFPYIYDGPNWQGESFYFYQYCRSNWWKNILYINNLVNYNEMCLQQTWYLASDMQLFLFLAPLMIFLCKLNKIYPHIFTLLALIAQLIVRVVLTNNSQYGIGFLIFFGWPDAFGSLYIQAYTRFGPYVLGMYAGFLLFEYGNRWNALPVRIKLLVGGASWPIIFLLYSFVLFITQPYYAEQQTASLSMAVFYNSAHRVIWALAVVFMILLCSTGMAGIINRFLSCNFFAVLSRLSYCVFLIHPSVMFAFKDGVYNAIMVNSMTMAVLFVGVVTITHGLAILIALAIEIPMLNLDKIMFS